MSENSTAQLQLFNNCRRCGHPSDIHHVHVGQGGARACNSMGCRCRCYEQQSNEADPSPLMNGTAQLFQEVTHLINLAESRLATLRYDDRIAVPTNPQGSIGDVVQEAERSLEAAKKLIRERES